MNATLRQASAEALDFLATLVRDAVPPKPAQARLRLLRERFPALQWDLLWEEEEYDLSVHYDALLHLPGEGTASLSYCPERSLPWPMRGARRWSEADLVRVNNTVLKVDQAVACLDFIWDEARIVDRLVNTALIQETLDRDPIELSEEEMQRALDGFRRSHRLYKAEDTRRWMERHGLSHEQMENLVANEATVANLRDQVTAGRVEDYFAAHRAEFDTVSIARIEFPDEKDARRVNAQICTGASGFYEAAGRRFSETEGQGPRDLFAVLRRGELPSGAGADLFSAAPGDVVGPVRWAEGYAVVHVLSSSPARLDEPTRAAIQKILFEEWLAGRRSAATIEWNWGSVSRTSPDHRPAADSTPISTVESPARCGGAHEDATPAGPRTC